MKMKLSFRWYGEDDPISLQYISQIPGMRSIVSAVYDVKPGEVWPEESLKKMQAQCEANNLVFDVVVPHNYSKNPTELKEEIGELVKEIDQKYRCVINIDYDYTG